MMRFSLLLLLLSGCPAPRAQCDRNRPSALELRDGNGVLLLAAKPGEHGTLDLCDPQLARLGSIKEEAAAVTLLDRGGAPRLILKKTGPDDGEGTGPDGQSRVRLHREGDQLFVLDPVGIRLAMVVSGPKTIYYDRAQTPAGSIEARGPDQAIRDPDGATQLLVQPAGSSQAAGVFTTAGLDRSEQFALYLLLQR